VEDEMNQEENEVDGMKKAQVRWCYAYV